MTTVTAFSVCSRFLSFIFKIYISRALGAEIVGLYQICISVLILLLSLTAGGLPNVLSRKIAEAEVKGNYKRQNSLMAQSLLIGLTASAIVIIVLYSLGDKLSIIFADDRCVDMFLIMLPAVLTSTLYALIRSWFWGRKKFLAFSFTEFLDSIFKIAFSAFFISGIISSISGAIGISIAFILADVLCVLILFILYFANGGRLAKPTGFLELEKSAIPITTTHIAGSAVNSLTAIVIPAQLVLIGMTTPQATAEYGRLAGMALPLLMAPSSLIGSLAVVLTPEIASYATQGDNKALLNKLESSLAFCVFITSMFLAVYAPLGKNLGVLFFGDEMAGVYVSQCCLLILPIGINQVASTVVNSLGMENKCLLHFLIGIAILLPCIFFLPRVIGIYAMPVGSMLSNSVLTILNMRSLRKKLGQPIHTWKKSLLLLLFALPSAALTYFLQGILTHFLPTVLVIILAGGAGVGIFVTLSSVFKVVQIGSFIANKFHLPLKKKSAVANKA
ncbi:MAG TPA: oligosaccharide flippase family protein [Clostridia bacterium]|nr:oligosaccharide flippase family protein [Clostridia bacterium]